MGKASVIEKPAVSVTRSFPDGHEGPDVEKWAGALAPIVRRHLGLRPLEQYPGEEEANEQQLTLSGER